MTCQFIARLVSSRLRHNYRSASLVNRTSFEKLVTSTWCLAFFVGSVVCKGSDWIWHLLQRETRENWLLLTFISSTFESYLVRAQTFHLVVWVWRIMSLLGEERGKFLWRLWRALRLVIATNNLSRYIAHFPPIFEFIYWRLDSHKKTMFVGKYDAS